MNLAPVAERAAEHIQAGRRIVPLPPNRKKKPPPNWQELASTEVDRVKRWSEKNPNANIAWCLPPDIGVVDVDPRNGGDATFALLDLIYGFPDTMTVRTAGGGTHRY